MLQTAPGPKYKAALATAYGAGLRVSEVVAVKIGDIDPRGPSIDAVTSAKAKKGAPAPERLAHRACNTRKGAVKAVVPWPSDIFVIEPAPIVEAAERLSRKGGREVVARCPTRHDAEQAGAWLVDRLSRLAPELSVTARAEAGGGQFLLVLAAP